MKGASARRNRFFSHPSRSADNNACLPELGGRVLNVQMNSRGTGEPRRREKPRRGSGACRGFLWAVCKPTC